MGINLFTLIPWKCIVSNEQWSVTNKSSVHKPSSTVHCLQCIRISKFSRFRPLSQFRLFIYVCTLACVILNFIGKLIVVCRFELSVFLIFFKHENKRCYYIRALLKFLGKILIIFNSNRIGFFR